DGKREATPQERREPTKCQERVVDDEASLSELWTERSERIPVRRDERQRCAAGEVLFDERMCVLACLTKSDEELVGSRRLLAKRDARDRMLLDRRRKARDAACLRDLEPR